MPDGFSPLTMPALTPISAPRGYLNSPQYDYPARFRVVRRV